MKTTSEHLLSIIQSIVLIRLNTSVVATLYSDGDDAAALMNNIGTYAVAELKTHRDPCWVQFMDVRFDVEGNATLAFKERSLVPGTDDEYIEIAVPRKNVQVVYDRCKQFNEST